VSEGRRTMLVRFKRPMPFLVHGGLTTWRISFDVFDKNGKAMEVFASCIEDGRYLVVTKGRTKEVTRELSAGIFLMSGTPEQDMVMRIMRKAVRDGLAEEVTQRNETW
jgi:hypothetical protein